jgi:hypothetical protein
MIEICGSVIAVTPAAGITPIIWVARNVNYQAHVTESLISNSYRGVHYECGKIPVLATLLRGFMAAALGSFIVLTGCQA